MSTIRPFEDRLGTWLESGPVTAPDAVTDTVLAAFPAIRQRRPWLVIPVRVPRALRMALLAAAALVLAIVGARLFLPPLGSVGPPHGLPSGWTFYRSVQYPYTIALPKTWVHRDATRSITTLETPWGESDGVDYLTPDAINGNPGIIVAGPEIEAGAVLDDWASATTRATCGPLDSRTVDGFVIASVEPTTVDREPALLHTYYRCFGFYHIWVVVLHGDRAFHIVWINVGGSEATDRETFKEVLATFRFTN